MYPYFNTVGAGIESETNLLVFIGDRIKNSTSRIKHPDSDLLVITRLHLNLGGTFHQELEEGIL